MNETEREKPVMLSPMVNQPEYLRAIGLVAVQINLLEFMLAAIFGVTTNMSPEVARAIYYAPRSPTARVDLLEAAATKSLGGNKHLQSRVLSVCKTAKGVFTERNDVMHDVWTVPSGETQIWRFSAGLPGRAAEASLDEMRALVERARHLADRCAVLMARLTIGRQIQEPWPDTIAEVNKWLRDNPLPTREDSEAPETPPRSSEE
jgi:hypothetical protein